MHPCNPIRLGIALNFSVFQYEICGQRAKACELGEQSLADALEKMDDVDPETFKEGKKLIDLLRENL